MIFEGHSGAYSFGTEYVTLIKLSSPLLKISFCLRYNTICKAPSSEKRLNDFALLSSYTRSPVSWHKIIIKLLKQYILTSANSVQCSNTLIYHVHGGCVDV